VIVQPLIVTSRSVLWRLIDNALIDGIVDGIAAQTRTTGNLLRKLQSGNLRSYAAWIVIGSVVLVFFMTLSGAAR